MKRYTRYTGICPTLELEMEKEQTSKMTTPSSLATAIAKEIKARVYEALCGDTSIQPIEEFRSIIQRHLTPLIEKVERQEKALKIADDRLHIICGSYMAIAHGEPEAHFYETINTMGPDMDVVSKALKS